MSAVRMNASFSDRSTIASFRRTWGFRGCFRCPTEPSVPLIGRPPIRRELGTFFVADYNRFFSTASAYALVLRTTHDTLNTRKVAWQFLSARMPARSFHRVLLHRVLTLPPLYRFASGELKQLHLTCGKLFTACSILLDPHLAQTLFEHSNS